MRGSHHIYFVVFIILFNGLPASGVQLSEIPGLVESANQEVRAAGKDVEAASQAIWTARSRYYPALNLMNTYLHLGNNLQVQLPQQTVSVGALTGSFSLPPITLQQQDMLLSNLVVKMPLFTGGRISAGVDAAKAKHFETRANRTKIAQEKTQEAIVRYFGVELARQVTEVLKTLEKDLDRIRGIADSLVKTGLGTKFSVMQLKVAQAELNSKIAEASGKADVADLAFKVSVGKGGSENVVYETALRKVLLPPKIDVFKEQALKNRAEFQILQAKAEQVGALKAVRVGESLPTLYAVGSKVIASQNLPVLQPGFAVGVVLDIPITGLFQSISEHREALRLEEKVQITRSRALEEIPLLIEKTYAELRATEASYRATEEAVDLAKEGMRLAEVRFKSGNGSSLEVLKSSTDLEKAQIRRIQLLEEYNRKLLELYVDSGDVKQFLTAYETHGEKK